MERVCTKRHFPPHSTAAGAGGNEGAARVIIARLPADPAGLWQRFGVLRCGVWPCYRGPVGPAHSKGWQLRPGEAHADERAPCQALVSIMCLLGCSRTESKPRLIQHLTISPELWAFMMFAASNSGVVPYMTGMLSC